MTTDERFKQLGDGMVEMLRKQDRTGEKLARLREGQSELNTKVVRVENRVERVENRAERVEKYLENIEGSLERAENRLERVEDKLEDTNRNVLELRRDTEKFQQEITAGLAQIVDLIRGLN